jgi:hypothetical protein
VPGAPQPDYWGAAQPAVYEPGNSVMAIIAGIWLLLVGLLVTFVSAIGFAIGQGAMPFLPAGAEADAIRGAFAVILGIFLVIGVLHLLSGIFIFAHRGWARWIGVVLALLGTLLGVASLFGATSPRFATDADAQSTLATAIVVLVGYGFTLLALIFGGKHFERRRVQ